MIHLFKRNSFLMAVALTAAVSLFGASNGSCKKPCGAPKCAPKCEPKCAPEPCPPKPCTPPCPQPCPPTQVCPGQDPCCPPWSTPLLNAAYGYPAHNRVACPWNVYVDASFIYWQPMQENMSLGLMNSTTGVVTSQILESTANTAFPNGLNGEPINMDFDYDPGFQVAVGGYFDYDNWDLMGQYTWFHNTQSQSATATTGQQIFPAWGHPLFQGNNAYNTASESWNLKVDLLELTLGRWYYLGTQLTVRPSVGARTAWIRQNATVTYVNNGTLGTGVTDTNVNKSKTRSWAIGPEFTLDANWLLGYGFRFYGQGEADILFTKYTKASTHVTHTTATATPSFKVNGSNVLTLRSHFDLELGFGWSTYFDCHNWLFDVSAGYGFQVFFDQNMLPFYNDDIMIAQTIAPNGNLYLQGMTLRFKLEF